MPVPSLGLYWTHPDGDPTTVPCVHIVPQHPGGDVITTPCLHPLKDPKIEYNVGCTLWDLFDTVRSGSEADGMAVAFSELFKVYSPTMVTLTAPPLITDIDDYLTRFVRNNPKLAQQARAIRADNCGP